ncbi:PREDICTED: uncharacterized protein LOC104825741 [Tarenaya hassleriana]|uniref:uncharacterized protein LOC104825741 n=1 Tax=Tarenaya hassleriana TaxID=28532 RepID=UPI00053C3E8B|nr:PREDICTED: uncharacterized protein LOC104825741 [Tarenaya hassleriana]
MAARVPNKGSLNQKRSRSAATQDVSASKPPKEAPPTFSTKKELRSGTITELTESSAEITKGQSPELKFSKKDEARDAIERFKNIPFKPSKFISKDTVKELGIEGCVDYIFDKLGWTKLCKDINPTFKSVAVEILATYHCYFPEDGTIEEAYMEFRLNRKWVRLTMGQVAEALEIPKGSTWKIPTISSRALQKFWKQIAIREFSSSTARASHIQHPAIRYAHQIIASTILARHEPGKVHKLDLAYLYEALLEFHGGWSLNSFSRSGWTTLDTASRITIYIGILSQTTAKNVNICIGGILKKIARRVNTGITFRIPDSSIEDSQLDVETLKLRSHIEKGTGSWIFADSSEVKRSVKLSTEEIATFSVETLRLDFLNARPIRAEGGIGIQGAHTHNAKLDLLNQNVEAMRTQIDVNTATLETLTEKLSSLENLLQEKIMSIETNLTDAVERSQRHIVREVQKLLNDQAGHTSEPEGTEYDPMNAFDTEMADHSEE